MRNFSRTTTTKYKQKKRLSDLVYIINNDWCHLKNNKQNKNKAHSARVLVYDVITEFISASKFSLGLHEIISFVIFFCMYMVRLILSLI